MYKFRFSFNNELINYRNFAQIHLMTTNPVMF